MFKRAVCIFANGFIGNAEPNGDENEERCIFDKRPCRGDTSVCQTTQIIESGTTRQSFSIHFPRQREGREIICEVLAERCQD